jgi:hypothetical protein
VFNKGDLVDKPNNKIQFAEGDYTPFSELLNEDEALALFFRDTQKLINSRMTAFAMRAFLKETHQAARMLIKPPEAKQLPTPK